jgi:hypothetical protein
LKMGVHMLAHYLLSTTLALYSLMVLLDNTIEKNS